MDVSWAQLFTVKDVLVAWRRRMKKCFAFGVWKIIPSAIWWIAWEERNRRIFEGVDPLKILSFIFLRILYSWSRALDGGANLTILDFVDNISQGA